MRHASSAISPIPKNAGWDDDPAAYDQLRLRSGWITERRRNFLHTWLTSLPAASEILEIGSGTGRMLLELAAAIPDRSWTGLEPLPSYQSYAEGLRQQYSPAIKIKFCLGAAEQADLKLKPLAAFSAVISNDVLHHLEDYDRALTAIASVTTPDAEWCAIEPNVLNPYAAFNQWRKPHERNFWPRPFLVAAQRAGWRLKRKDYLFLIPPFIPHPPVWLKRLEEKLEKMPFLAGGVAIILKRN